MKTVSHDMYMANTYAECKKQLRKIAYPGSFPYNRFGIVHRTLEYPFSIYENLIHVQHHSLQKEFGR